MNKKWNALTKAERGMAAIILFEKLLTIRLKPHDGNRTINNQMLYMKRKLTNQGFKELKTLSGPEVMDTITIYFNPEGNAAHAGFFPIQSFNDEIIELMCLVTGTQPRSEYVAS